MEWSPIVAVLEQSAEELLDLGLKTDLLIARKDIIPELSLDFLLHG